MLPDVLVGYERKLIVVSFCSFKLTLILLFSFEGSKILLSSSVITMPKLLIGLLVSLLIVAIELGLLGLFLRSISYLF